MKKEDAIRAKALSMVGAPYVWGGTGVKCTVRYRKQRMQQYPAHADAIRNNCPALKQGLDSCVPGCKYIGKPAMDCAQLVRIAFKAGGINLPSGASSQWRRGPWIEKDTIDKMPLDQVCAVFHESPASNPMNHVGLYMGDGTVVDARGSRYGVLHKSLKAYPWTHFAQADLTGEVPGVPSPESPIPVPVKPAPAPSKPQITLGIPTLRYGHRGNDVARMQDLLNKSGAVIAADGIFGRKTLAAVKAFQAARGLKPDGVVGQKTWLALMEGR